ncbi:MAG: TlpA disulfide reductase family protein [Lachnospiraceae bacterium]
MRKRIWMLAAVLFVLTGCGAAADGTEIQAEEGIEESILQEEEKKIENDGKEAEIAEDEAAAAGDSDGMTGEFASFTAMDFEGNTVDQALIAGADLTVLNIWGTFCGPCIQEMPDLGELAEEYAGTGVQIVGIAVDVYDEEGIRTAQTIIDETGADYLHLLPTQELYDIYLSGVSAVPTTVLVDKNGTIVDTVVGSRSKDDWKTLIDEVKQGL